MEKCQPVTGGGEAKPALDSSLAGRAVLPLDKQGLGGGRTWEEETSSPYIYPKSFLLRGSKAGHISLILGFAEAKPEEESQPGAWGIRKTV